MAILLALDADNTLWDTATVFQNARSALLSEVKSPEPNETASGIDTLRTIDRELARLTSSFEYDARILCSAAYFHFAEGRTLEDASSRALARREDVHDPEPTIRRAIERYTTELQRIPALYAGTEEALAEIRRAHQNVVMILFSEGDPDRVRRTLECHGRSCKILFDDVVLCPKSSQSWEEVRNAGRRRLGLKEEQDALCVLVGDSLERDIAPGKEAGFVTVYKPSAFLGPETPRGSADRPDYTIASLAEMPSLLKKLSAAQNRISCR